MRVVTILARDFDQMKNMMDLAYPFADLFEMRLDSLANFDRETLLPIIKKSSRPLIFTLRRKEQGGFFGEPEKKRFENLMLLAAFKPDYMDLEYDLPIELIEDIKKVSPNTSLIGSFHDLQKTEENLSSIYCQLSEKPFDHHKIVTYASSSLDVLRVMHFLKSSAKSNLSCMCLGKKGESSRILAKACGSEMVYGYVGEKKIEGQLSLNELVSIYHIPSGKDDRPIYGLIGEPLEQSIGHLYHNKAFQGRALYVKLSLTQDELNDFFLLEENHPLFSGLSITTPLKEVVSPFIDLLSEDARQIGALNTLYYQKRKRCGENTDGKGAIEAIMEKKNIKGLSIAIIGTGPTARAVAWEAKKRKAKVTLFSRHVEKATTKLPLEEFEIKDLRTLNSQMHFDCFIDASGTGIRNSPSCYARKDIPSSHYYMHLSLPSKETILYEEVMNRKGEWIFGEKMFSYQADHQQRIWNFL